MDGGVAADSNDFAWLPLRAESFRFETSVLLHGSRRDGYRRSGKVLAHAHARSCSCGRMRTPNHNRKDRVHRAPCTTCLHTLVWMPTRGSNTMCTHTCIGPCEQQPRFRAHWAATAAACAKLGSETAPCTRAVRAPPEDRDVLTAHARWLWKLHFIQGIINKRVRLQRLPIARSMQRRAVGRIVVLLGNRLHARPSA